MPPQDSIRYQTMWLRGGNLYVPTIGRPPSGVFFEIDPVLTLAPTRDSLNYVVERCISRHYAVIKERDRFSPEDWPKMSVVQKAAGAKTWKAFAKNSLSLAMIGVDTGWEISVGQGNDPADVETIRLGPVAGQDELVEELLNVIVRRPIWKG